MVRAETRWDGTGVSVLPEERAPFTFFEGIDFKLRVKGSSAGDTTICRHIGELTDDLRGRGNFFSAHAKEYLRCFQPVSGVQCTTIPDVPTLFDQLNPTLEQCGTGEQREFLEYLVHDVTKSIVEQQQPRPANTRRSDDTQATREIASEFLVKLEDRIMERLEPTPVAGKTQRNRFIQISVRIGESAGLIYLGSQLGACMPTRSITPDITPPAITLTVPAMETPSSSVTSVPTVTEKPTLMLTPTSEQLGGSKMAYLFDNFRSPMPEGLHALLTPSSPDTWQKPTGLLFTDGTPVPWQNYVIAREMNGFTYVGIPVLVRGVFETPNLNRIAGGELFYPILEVPAFGGSNFLIPVLDVNKYAMNPNIGINYINNGKIPPEWFAGSLASPMDVATFESGYKFTGLYTHQQIVDLLQQYTGRVVIVGWTIGALPANTACLEQVVQNWLINQNGQSQTDAMFTIINVTLP